MLGRHRRDDRDTVDERQLRGAQCRRRRADDAADDQTEREEEGAGCGRPPELHAAPLNPSAARARREPAAEAAQRAAADRLFDVAERELGEDQRQPEAKGEGRAARPTDIDSRTRHDVDRPVP